MPLTDDAVADAVEPPAPFDRNQMLKLDTLQEITVKVGQELAVLQAFKVCCLRVSSVLPQGEQCVASGCGARQSCGARQNPG